MIQGALRPPPQKLRLLREGGGHIWYSEIKNPETEQCGCLRCAAGLPPSRWDRLRAFFLGLIDHKTGDPGMVAFCEVDKDDLLEVDGPMTR
jgi:hypothetical protein